MAQTIKIYYDRESDFLEVRFCDKPGFMRETNHDDVMERVSEDGEILGFTIMQVSRHEKENPLIAHLV
ncbi:MAG: DUF2283 domain-containing protein [Nitrospinae bacterium CG11_big_fil_rev_8_21_14_0_20_56_8]|nr:MAG: DUF2283 domain-containing protein [Nitrospinae bacterium CG11_big_fil_rev_8_21_14_0_20_56_8]